MSDNENFAPDSRSASESRPRTRGEYGSRKPRTDARRGERRASKRGDRDSWGERGRDGKRRSYGSDRRSRDSRSGRDGAWKNNRNGRDGGDGNWRDRREGDKPRRDGERRWSRDDKPRRDGERRWSRDDKPRHDGDRRWNKGSSKNRDGDRRRGDAQGRGQRFSKGERGYRDQRDKRRFEQRERMSSAEGFEADRQERLREGREPFVPADITGNELAPELRATLKALTKEQMERVSRHLVACAMLTENEPERALEHAKWAARFGARVASVRELYGALLYEAGDYRGAIREMRAAMRMSGKVDLLPIVADCERGLGRPEKAFDIAQSDEAAKLTNAETIELMMVVAGAYADLGDLDTAIATLEIPALRSKVDGKWQFRLWLAYADLLEAAGRADEAKKWVTLAADADVNEETDAYARLGRAPRPREAAVERTEEEIGVFDVEADFERAEREAAEREAAKAEQASDPHDVNDDPDTSEDSGPSEQSHGDVDASNTTSEANAGLEAADESRDNPDQSAEPPLLPHEPTEEYLRSDKE